MIKRWEKVIFAIAIAALPIAFFAFLESKYQNNLSGRLPHITGAVQSDVDIRNFDRRSLGHLRTRERSSKDRVANDLSNINLSNLSVEQLRERLVEQIERSPKVDVTTLEVFAGRAGSRKEMEDFSFILNSGSSTGQLRKIMENYFRSASNGSPDHDIEFMIDSIIPGTNRSSAIYAYFKTLDISVEVALNVVSKFSYPEDRVHALQGLASFRVWLPSDLVELTKRDEDQSQIKHFFTEGIMESVFRKRSNWAEEGWLNLLEVPDASQRQILAGILFSEIGMRQPETAINLLSRLSESERSEILSGPNSSIVISSWSSKSPEECLKYLRETFVDAPTKERLVSIGMNQWIMSDPNTASKWLANNLDNPYMLKPVKNLIHWLEQRGEDASSWKEVVKDLEGQ